MASIEDLTTSQQIELALGGALRGFCEMDDTESEEIAEILTPTVRRLMADELCAIADGTRSTEVLFRHHDGSGVKYGDLLRERAVALRSVHS